MQSKTILGKDGEPKAHEIKVELQGRGGKLGIKNMQILTKMIEDLKSRETPDEVDQLYFMICGYYACCVNSGFIKHCSCHFCKGNRLHTCTGYDCREPYQKAYEYAKAHSELL